MASKWGGVRAIAQRNTELRAEQRAHHLEAWDGNKRNVKKDTCSEALLHTLLDPLKSSIPDSKYAGVVDRYARPQAAINLGPTVKPNKQSFLPWGKPRPQNHCCPVPLRRSSSSLGRPAPPARPTSATMRRAGLSVCTSGGALEDEMEEKERTSRSPSRASTIASLGLDF